MALSIKPYPEGKGIRATNDYGKYLISIAKVVKGTPQQAELESLYQRVQNDAQEYLNTQQKAGK